MSHESNTKLYSALERANISSFLLDELQAHEDVIGDSPIPAFSPDDPLYSRVAVGVIRSLLDAVRTGTYVNPKQWVTRLGATRAIPTQEPETAGADFWRS